MENQRLTLCPCFMSTISTTSALALWKCWHIFPSSAPTAAGTLSLYRIIPLPNSQRAASADLSLLSHLMQRLCKKNSREVSTENLFGSGSLRENLFFLLTPSDGEIMPTWSVEDGKIFAKGIQQYPYIRFITDNKKAIKLSSTGFPLYLTLVRSESDHTRLMGFACLIYCLKLT